ncbi:MFS transporter [Massilia sp. PAMC28688]|uniref:MFS transporter n=1 Tax=Massilia sp. PAMC28688 TaxID=2861283 RepID=UPI001C62BD26|nr:MFS transporter [Massilia sp. PAMC28688]QYF95656.1 MFS transporter [Massilia sp. PAMC28688]
MTVQARTVLVVAALQFVYILDFVMVLPLGPDLARALGFAVDRAALLTAAYTLASVLASLACLHVLDRFNRKTVLLVSFGLLALATWASSMATGLDSLLLARAVTGMAGAPAIATGMALVIDVTPPAQRGRTLARVMAGFALAAVAGVPMALELARFGGWQLPFQSLAALALLVWLVAAIVLPAPAGRAAQGAGLGQLLRRGPVRHACVVQGLSQFSAFLLIPHFSAYYLFNLGYPRAHLGVLYMAGGVTAFVTVQVLGRLADRAGPRQAVLMASAAMALGVIPLLVDARLLLPVLVLCFVCFMAGNAGRNVSLLAALSHVPRGDERAAFMALQGMVQDVAIAAAALVSGAMLAQGTDGTLSGMGMVLACAAVTGAAVPLALSGQKQYVRATH